MKPCPRCREPLHNKATECACGWTQAAGGIGVQQAEPYEGPEPPPDSTWWDVAKDLIASPFSEGLPGIVAVAVGAGLGAYMAGTTGAVVGVAIAVGLFAISLAF